MIFMKLKLILSLALTMFTCLNIQAQNAHSNIIDEAFADLRGQVLMTFDRGDTAKVWNIADGKLLVTFSKNSTEWNTKLLRYKINHPDYTLSGSSTEITKDARGVWSSIYTLNNQVVGIHKPGKGRISWNLPSRKAVEFDAGNNTTIINAITFPAAGSEDKNVTAKILVKLPYYSYPEFSPKGTWLFGSYPGELIHPETGVVTEIPADIKMLTNQVAQYAFSADESLLAVSTENGIAIIETATAKLVKEIKIPKKIKEKEGYTIYPLSDMQSFVYTGGRYDWSGKGDTKKAWLVKESGAIELVD